ncbi:glycosyl transferase [Paramagnetospirillum kuznetsovii]|uniref:Glycosyl transferase n=1 Tax=Paramagnetospirillum kuznetsovii TaxID=2053833 RepID=A0A364P2X7_9PROT|nr:glycosyltransferase family 2 protein [Paramagnetospirillum kuznetsovii]RAU23620.1 glycosyl transferase [Paramagnetospirillum kuznetsovii]
MSLTKLTIVIPCYNEEKTLEAIVDRVIAADRCGLDLEMVIVDDGSRDKSVEVMKALAAKHPQIKTVEHGINQGKGAALRTGFQHATGDIVLVQDADLEYSPSDYPKLLKPFLDGRADVVFGSRFKGGDESRVLYFWHSIGNRVLTLTSNMFTDLNLTDMETCYKAFKREIIQSVTIIENRFGFEPEITAKVARMRPRPRIYEVGISYSGRTYEEGKKIGWRDGVRALYCIIRYNLLD